MEKSSKELQNTFILELVLIKHKEHLYFAFAILTNFYMVGIYTNSVFCCMLQLLLDSKL